jgi:hypothetical protein
VEDHRFGLTLLKAEQVSHHPPVSAVCMRNEHQKVQFSSNVLFGITFHGNSVSCKLQGRADVDLENLKETYTVCEKKLVSRSFCLFVFFFFF